MKKDTIYVDNDDEITSITDKVQSATNPIVALVLPKRCTVLQSTVNMKILNRAATTAGKKVVLITSEAALLPVAGSAGMFVAKTLQSKPAIPATPSYDENQIDEVKEVDDDSDLDTTKTIGELAGATAVAAMAVSDDDEAPIELGDDEPDQKLDDTPKDKKADKKNKKLKVPNFDSFRLKLFAAIGGVILLIVAWYLMSVVLPRAIITITTENKVTPVSMTITGSTTAKTLDADKQIVPAVTQTLDKAETKKFAATGQKNVGTKATGTITIFNCTDLPNTVPAGTLFTNNGFSFALNESVTVPASNFTSGGNCKNDGKVSGAAVTATNPGDQYNLSSGRTYSSNYSSRVTGIGSSMSGGTTKNIKVVSASDCDTAKNELLNTNTDAYKATLTAQLIAAGLTPLKDTFVATPSPVSCNPGVDVEAAESTATVTFKNSMMGVNTASLNQLVQNEINKKLESTQSILDTGVKTATLTVTEHKANGDIVFTLTTDAQTGIKQDPAVIVNSVAGKKKGETISTIESQPGVKDVKVEYSPFWVSKTPKNVNHITVKFVNSK